MATVLELDNPKLRVRDLDFYYGQFQALKKVSLDIAEKKVTAFIGPSGCGKSTLLRTFNRMFELYPEQRAKGEILMDGENLLASKRDVSLIRAKVGMVISRRPPLPDVDLRQHRLRRSPVRAPAQGADGRAGRVGAAEGGALERGEGQAAPERREPLGRPAAACASPAAWP